VGASTSRIRKGLHGLYRDKFTLFWEQYNESLLRCKCVTLLYLLLVISTSSGRYPVGLATIFYCIRFEATVSVASYDSQGYILATRPCLHMGFSSNCPVVLLITPSHGPSRKHRLQQYLYCCMRICCRGNVFIGLSPRKGSTRNVLKTAQRRFKQIAKTSTNFVCKL
jgi:hypothetical protein